MPAYSARRPRQPRKASARRRKLLVDVIEEGPSWCCLAGRSPKRLVAEVATGLAHRVELPALTSTATLVMATDARLRELNQQWRAQDKPTNVLSFPAPPPAGRTGRAGTRASAHFMGDVILAQETLVREAAEQGITAIDHFRHLVLHGLLHLAGYDHETEEEATVMEALETSILADLGVADPYAFGTPIPKEHVKPRSAEPVARRSGTAKR